MELVEEEPATGDVRLEPLAVDDELGNGALADLADEFGGSCGILVDIDFGVPDAVSIKKLLGGAAVAAPPGRINLDYHANIVLRAHECYM